MPIFQFLQSNKQYQDRRVSKIVVQGVRCLDDKSSDRGNSFAIGMKSSSSSVGADVVLAPVVELAAAGRLVRIRRSDVPERPEQRLLWHCGRTGRHTSTALELLCLGSRLCCSRQCVLL